MPPTYTIAERRLTHRVKVCGSAVLRSAGRCVTCRITDLSTGGIGVRSDEIRGFFKVSIGDEVEVDLQLEPGRGLRVSHRGTVRHIDAAGARAGISFSECLAQDPVAEDLRSDDAAPPLRVVRASDAVADGAGAVLSLRLPPR